MVTDVWLQCERKLIPAPTPYKHTEIGKRQVTIIRLLQTLQRRFTQEQDPAPVLARLHTMEVLYEITPANLQSKIKEERQYLYQIQQDIDIHRDKHL